MIIAATGCHSQQESKKRTSLLIVSNLQADSLYQQAIALMESSYDVDSTRKCIRFLDKALAIDSLNPDYYGMKAKLLSEMGELDSAYTYKHLLWRKTQLPVSICSNWDYFKLPKICTLKPTKLWKKQGFPSSSTKTISRQLGSFILAEAANSLYENKDSLFMRNIDEIRKRFPERLLEIEMT